MRQKFIIGMCIPMRPKSNGWGKGGRVRRGHGRPRMRLPVCCPPFPYLALVGVSLKARLAQCLYNLMKKLIVSDLDGKLTNPFELYRLGMLMGSEPGNPQEVEGVLNP